MSESDFYKSVRDHTKGRLDMTRIESPLTPGIPDILCLSLSTKRVSWIEMKNIAEVPKTAPPKIKFRPGQPQFARSWEEKGGSAFVFVKLGKDRFLLFRANASVEWVRDISSPLSSEVLRRLSPVEFSGVVDWDRLVEVLS